MPRTLADWNCVQFHLTFRLTSQEFSIRKFQKLLRLDEEPFVDIDTLADGPREFDYHAHLHLQAYKRNGHLTVAIHPGVNGVQDETEHDDELSRRLSEIAAALRSPSLKGRSVTRFEYGETAMALPSLRYPLQWPDLKDVIVSGQEYTIGSGDSSKRVLVSVDGHNIPRVQVHSVRRVNLGKWDMMRMVANDASVAGNFILEDVDELFVEDDE